MLTVGVPQYYQIWGGITSKNSKLKHHKLLLPGNMWGNLVKLSKYPNKCTLEQQLSIINIRIFYKTSQTPFKIIDQKFPTLFITRDLKLKIHNTTIVMYSILEWQRATLQCEQGKTIMMTMQTLAMKFATHTIYHLSSQMLLQGLKTHQYYQGVYHSNKDSHTEGYFSIHCG